MPSLTLSSISTSPPPQEPKNTLTSLVFQVPFPSDASDWLRARYEALKAERGIDINENYTKTCAGIALDAYLDPELVADREKWCKEAKPTFERVVRENTHSLRHVDILLPGNGVLEPLNLFPWLEDLELESLSVQWPLRGSLPRTLILNPTFSDVFSKSEFPRTYAAFLASLTSLLTRSAPTIQRLRIALPQSTTLPSSPFHSLSFSPSLISHPLPHLEILDLTHHSPPIPALATILTNSTLLPNLKHLILDHGAEIPLSDFDDDDEIVEDMQERTSWAALGACLSARRPALVSLCAALHDARGSGWPIGVRMTPASLRSALATDVGELILCTAWPVSEDSPDVGNVAEGERDLYVHADGCGHLAYPSEQKPTVGLWPPLTEEGRAVDNLRGKPWY
ncbi:hypothetical protein R3P38DRAFT_3409124 [Favolaschia claudopus]|uniref:Uncharacterized protein n=1 Tax=Favolaschia claudopus TaxID=2862362 RepID=A0AAV9ZSQ8_9AGAR